MEHACNLEPRILRHARSNRAFVVLRDADGRRRQVTLGAWTDTGPSPESRRAYHAAMLRWQAEQRAPAAAALAQAPVEPDANLTVAGIAARFLAHAERYYRHPDGTPTGEAAHCARALAPLLALYADEPASSFGPRKLKVVVDRMVRGDPAAPPDRRRGWCRAQCNANAGRIRRLYKWAASEELVPASVHAALCTLPPLRRGRTDARESAPTKPVSDADVEKTLPHLPPLVADMVRIQHLVGMRPGELVAMTSAEIDRSESVRPGCWVFRPSRSKLSYRGRAVEYPLGPRAVEIVRRYLLADPHARLFTPARSEDIRHAAMRATRKTRVQPSQWDRRVADPERKPGDRYTTASYGHAVWKACRHAGVPVWGPHALRRAVATRVRAQYGIEAARAMLAHQTAAMAELYAHRDLKAAAEIAAKIG